jgi:hypothetical protein
MRGCGGIRILIWRMGGEQFQSPILINVSGAWNILDKILLIGNGESGRILMK